MSGIAGYFAALGERADQQLLLNMAGELRHRGPDGVGLYVDGPFGMVGARLATVDVVTGQQPAADEARRYFALLSGDIYNHETLRAELAAEGRRFRTSSDVELVAQAFAAWGPGCLDRFNGEFAIAVYDSLKGELFLARDRFGTKPLFIARYGGRLAFASEAKALLRHPSAERRLDPLALVETFSHWAVLPDRSAFVGIGELEPGHHLTADATGVGEQRKWWELEFRPDEEALRAPINELAEELLTRLREATRLRLGGDALVGVYLSGGLDSSAVTALARQLTDGPLTAFSLTFDDPRFDESEFQSEVADALGVQRHKVSVSNSEVALALPQVVRFAEKPMLRTAPGPLLALSRLAHDQGFKAVLTGEGSDELFGGYNIFQEAAVRRFWARDPDSTLRPRLLARLYPYLSRDLAAGGSLMTEFFKFGMSELDDPLYSHRPRFRTTTRNLRFLTTSVREEAALLGDPEARLLARLPAGFGELGPLSQAQLVEMTTFLTPYLLPSQGDRMMMANSVEGRFPFLDVNVAEFAAALPEKLRLNGIREKYLLKRALQGTVPEVINRRPKLPYRAPILLAFFGPDAPGYVQELLSAESLERSGLFNANAVTRLAAKAVRFAEHGLSESDEMGVVGILSTLLLEQQFVSDPALAEAATAETVIAPPN